jgi:hypothetical protein
MRDYPGADQAVAGAHRSQVQDSRAGRQDTLNRQVCIASSHCSTHSSIFWVLSAVRPSVIFLPTQAVLELGLYVTERACRSSCQHYLPILHQLQAAHAAAHYRENAGFSWACTDVPGDTAYMSPSALADRQSLRQAPRTVGQNCKHAKTPIQFQMRSHPDSKPTTRIVGRERTTLAGTCADMVNTEMRPLPAQTRETARMLGCDCKNSPAVWLVPNPCSHVVTG